MNVHEERLERSDRAMLSAVRFRLLPSFISRGLQARAENPFIIPT